MVNRLDFILDMRLRGRSAIVGCVILGTLVVSILVFLLAGNHRVERVLYFPRDHGHGFVAEPRFLTRHRSMEGNIAELVNGVLLGPSRHDAARLFARGGSVRAAMVHGHTLFLDLTEQVLADDPDVPLAGADAFDALERSIRFNFPRVRDIVFYIDGQPPRVPEKKNI